MKKLSVSVSVVVALAMFAVGLMSGNALAETIKMVGTVQSFSVSGDQKSVTVVVKDNKTENNVTIVISDENTVTKFKEHLIKNGDEVRSTFEKSGDVNKAKIFKKTAGC